MITFSSVGALVDQASDIFDRFIGTELEAKMKSLKNTFYLDEDGNMGIYKLLFVQFSEDTWDKEVELPNSEFIFIVPEYNDQVGNCTQWQSFDRFKGEFFYGSRAFACTLITEEFKDLVDSPEDFDDNVQILINKLFHALGLNDTPGCLRVSEGSDDYCKRIDLFPEIDYCDAGDSSRCVYEIRDEINPNWKGAWSTFKPGNWYEEGDYDNAREPVSDTLYFGGEALCPFSQGFQHGAWDSGRLQARKMIYELRGMDVDVQEKWEGISNAYLTSPVCDLPV